MNVRSVNISSLVILMALLSFILEGFLYYFLYHPGWVLLLAAIVSLVLSHFFLETSFSYQYCFLYAAFMVISTLIYSIIIYCIQPNKLLPYGPALGWLVAINWLVPFLYCMIRDINDKGPRFDRFRLYLIRMTILYAIPYVVILLQKYFLHPIEPPYQKMPFGAQNFIPFMATGTYVETALAEGTNLTPLIQYMLIITALFIPYGFFFRVYMEKMFYPLRLLCYISFPLIMELSQYVIGIGRGHIDDFALALFGTCIGTLFYHLMNGIYHFWAGRDFAKDRTQIKVSQFLDL